MNGALSKKGFKEGEGNDQICIFTLPTRYDEALSCHLLELRQKRTSNVKS